MSQKTSGKFLSTKRVEISLTHQNGFYIQHDLAFVTQDILTAVSDLQVFKHLFLVIQIIFVSTRSRFKIFPVQNSSTALIWTALRPQNLKKKWPKIFVSIKPFVKRGWIKQVILFTSLDV
eukprot:TRINITY_DN16155_c0_g1_i2.p4 TRINITY_DN16155_c0_g1~~TRINITY_DN16155_c0_g1_i2.p4  ORF type:complete len:120 (-),score=7.66 TRINITY_DN16155_c0_g1_i2:374-733(-)